MKPIRWSLLAIVVATGVGALFASACGTRKAVDGVNQSADTQWATLTGTLVYRERMLLPPGTTGVVVLTDRARFGDDAAWLGTDQLRDLVAPPMAFSIRYDAAALRPGVEYGLRATLYDVDGKPVFATPELFLVDLEEGPPLEGVTVVLHRAGPGATATRP